MCLDSWFFIHSAIIFCDDFFIIRTWMQKKTLGSGLPTLEGFIIILDVVVGSSSTLERAINKSLVELNDNVFNELFGTKLPKYKDWLEFILSGVYIKACVIGCC